MKQLNAAIMTTSKNIGKDSAMLESAEVTAARTTSSATTTSMATASTMKMVDPMLKVSRSSTSPSQPQQLPEPWQEFYDPITRLPYYYDPRTGITQWERPETDPMMMTTSSISSSSSSATVTPPDDGTTSNNGGAMITFANSGTKTKTKHGGGRGRNKGKKKKKNPNTGNAGYDSPGVYKDTGSAAGGGMDYQWSSGSSHSSSGGGKSGKGEGGWPEGSIGGYSSGIYNNKPKHIWTKVPDELVGIYRPGCTCTYEHQKNGMVVKVCKCQPTMLPTYMPTHIPTHLPTIITEEPT